MAKKQKRVGFVCDDLTNFHSNTYYKILNEDLKARGFTVSGGHALDHQKGAAWCAERNLPYFESAADLDAVTDYYMILAPNNPESHMELCKRIFPFRKTTYVDKTFAPDVATARKIFKLADKHGTTIQTSSALRYTNVQARVAELGGRESVQHMVAWGGGRAFEIYAIHPVELVISCMGPDARGLMRRGKGDHSQLLLNFTGGRTAVVNVYTNASTPFAASLTTQKATEFVPVESARIFINLAAAALDMFETGKAGIDRKESLMVRRILDVAADPEAQKAFVRL